ncbi:MAG: peptide-methionine (S)-S-oxide reductase [Candidatus Marinimicrobia bacterium]|nr:peptide-methionine (S)-S-oxide reductase [Candidatus Neomarinimicrobiota bacterium]
MDIATFGAGCFWCIEAILLNVPGVNSIEVGYTGGHIDNPTYKMICEGNTGHAEVAQIEFDNKKITYEQLLFIFFDIHDPTTLNRQGNDVGTQYRSSIFYHDSTQKELAEKVKSVLKSKYNNKIVTEITSLKEFYIAEDYHQNYYNNNKDAPYCNFVIKPKIEKYLNEKK